MITWSILFDKGRGSSGFLSLDGVDMFLVNLKVLLLCPQIKPNHIKSNLIKSTLYLIVFPDIMVKCFWIWEITSKSFTLFSWLAWPDWLGRCPIRHRAVGLVRGQGTCPGCRLSPEPQPGVRGGQAPDCVSLTRVFLHLSLSHPFPLKSVGMSLGEN